MKKQHDLFVVTVNNRPCSAFTDKNKAYKELCNHMFFWEMPYTNGLFQEHYDNGQYKEALKLVPSSATCSVGFVRDNFESDIFNVIEIRNALDGSEFED